MAVRLCEFESHLGHYRIRKLLIFNSCGFFSFIPQPKTFTIKTTMKSAPLFSLNIYETSDFKLILGSIENELCLCDWAMENDLQSRSLSNLITRQKAGFTYTDSPLLKKASVELDEYFNGTRKTFDIPCNPIGTNFQKAVWNELTNIPYGQTISYGKLASKIGLPKAVRAVANACGANPISIFIPCHRVIGSDGSLTGYGGGLDLKKFLLEREAPLSFFKE